MVVRKCQKLFLGFLIGFDPYSPHPPKKKEEYERGKIASITLPKER
jgi:hypothetical protein